LTVIRLPGRDGTPEFPSPNPTDTPPAKMKAVPVKFSVPIPAISISAGRPIIPGIEPNTGWTATFDVSLVRVTVKLALVKLVAPSEPVPLPVNV